MASIEKSVLVHHSAAAMFALVADIEAYPQFLPWCGGSRIIERVDAGTHARVTAEIVIAFSGIKQSFTTVNDQHADDRIDLELVSGPFSKLDGGWRFLTLADDACKVVLALDYDFDNFLLKKIVGPVFHQVATTMVDSFVRRADFMANERAAGAP